MSLIVEDGSIVAGAESYLSVSDADQYHANFGNSAWATLVTATKEQLLRQGCRYMQEAYRGRWQGFRVKASQDLDWPRQSVRIADSVLNAYVLYTIVPNEVKWANAILALKANAGDLAPDLGRTAAREKIGPIEVDYDNHAGPVYVRYRSVDLLLAAYLVTSGAQMMLTRT